MIGPIGTKEIRKNINLCSTTGDPRKLSTTLVRVELAGFGTMHQTGSQMIYVKYPNGTTRQGVLLTLGGNWIRVAIQGCDDAVEYRQVSGRWISEDCEVVTFEFSERIHDIDDPEELPALLTSQFQGSIVPLIMWA